MRKLLNFKKMVKYLKYIKKRNEEIEQEILILKQFFLFAISKDIKIQNYVFIFANFRYEIFHN